MTALELVQIIENTEFTDFDFMTEAEGNTLAAHIFVTCPETQREFRVLVTVVLDDDEEDALWDSELEL